MIGILYESDEWSDWKLAHELEALLGSDSVRMIDMEGPDPVSQALSCDLLVSRVFASARFRGHERSHAAMERLIAEAETHAITLINPARAHAFEIDKRLATETLRKAGITAPEIIACGSPEELLQVRTGEAITIESGSSDSSSSVNPPLEAWPYPCIIKPNCGGRTTYTAVLHSPSQAREFLEKAPDLVFIVEEYIEAVKGFLTRVEVVDGQIALVVKRSVAANGLSSYHEGSTYELYPDVPDAVVSAVLAAACLLDISFGSFDVIEAASGNFIIDANSVSNVSEDCTDLFKLDLMTVYAQALAAIYQKKEA